MRVLELKHQKSVEAVFKNPDISDDFINDQFKDSPQPHSKPLVQEDLKVMQEKGKDFNLEPEVGAVNGEHVAHEVHQENHHHEQAGEQNHEPEKHHEEHAPEVQEHHHE